MKTERILVAKKALAGFLKQPADDISCEPLTGGSDEATIVKCAHLGTSYVVKLFSSSESGKNEIAWTQHASDLGIGPKLYYADPSGSYMLIEFLEGNSLVPSTANTPAIIKSIATSLARLHHSYAPFAHTSDMFRRIDTKLQKLNCSGKLKNVLESGLELVKKIEIQLQSLAVSPVPCHNDLNPGNIFTDNNQVTLIDWDDAALGHHYHDIAAFFILNVIETKNENLFFEHYDAKLLNPQWQAYMQLYKQLVYFEFALNLLSGVQASKSELLQAQHIPQINNINYYLTLLAERVVEIDSAFLYNMAIASLSQMNLSDAVSALDMMKITKYDDINDLLTDLMTRIQAILGHRLSGVYLYGSLVWGDFDYDISDIDLLVVTETDIDENVFANLNKMHSDFVKKYKYWNNRIEIVYISKKALKTFKTQRSQIAVISPGEPFNIKDAGADWLLNWYFVQENSITLFGPDPLTIIEPISKDEYFEAVKNEALGWYEQITLTRSSRSFQSYAILTICRALYALHNGEQVSKKKATLWAQKQFPQWSVLIGNAMAWRVDHQNKQADPSATYPEVEKCVHELLDSIKKF